MAGAFVRDAVDAVRARGVDVEVVSPATFRHFGIAYGHGVLGNLRRRPWLVLALPFFLVGYGRAARRAAKHADIVHAHWLPSAIAAIAARKPFVLQLWGSDVQLARWAPFLFRPMLRRAKTVVVASSSLATAAWKLGARDVRIVPAGVAWPEHVGEPEHPPHVLYVGRLSPEKGILDLVEAAHGLPLVVVGDGPLRDRVPQAIGFVPPSRVGAFYAAAAIVCVPSRREGYGIAAREAMAFGRPVVSSGVGGLADAIEDGVTGVLYPPGEVASLRAALVRLLDDAELRSRIGAAARADARERFSHAAHAAALVGVYAEALR